MSWMASQKIAFDETAVAQHYGLPTGYVDLSQSLDVSTFFACCKWDSNSEEWRPVGDGEGVIYMVDVRHPDCVTVKPVCLQAFPRPSEQWAWAHKIEMSQDFDMFPHVRKFMFRHDFAASERILNRFDGGAALFPQDPLSRVANMIMCGNSVPRSIGKTVVEALIEDPLGLPGAEVQSVLAEVEQEMCIELSESESVSIMTSVMNEEMERIWATRFSGGKGIGVRLARRPRR